MKLTALMLVLALPLAATATPSTPVKNSADGVWTIKFEANGSTIRSVEETVEYTGSITELAGGQRSPDQRTLRTRAIPMAESLELTMKLKLMDKGEPIRMNLPRWDGGAPVSEIGVSSVEKTARGTTVMKLKADSLNANNVNSRPLGNMESLTVTFDEGTCEFAADQRTLECKMPIHLEGKCSSFLYCSF